MTPNGEIRWIRLGASVSLDDMVGRFQKFIRCPVKEASLTKLLHGLHEIIWQPIESALPEGTERLYVSLDGSLHAISLGILLDQQDHFLAEKYCTVYLYSGRELLRPVCPDCVQRTALVMADPTFLLSKKPNHIMDSLDNLPSSHREADQVLSSLKAAGVTTHYLVQAQATKAALEKEPTPWLIHLATHGLYLPEKLSDQPLALRLTNPMQRSVLVFAGGQNTLNSWANGEMPPRDNDGILTAREAGRLSLNGTWLVVLSACDTGSGEILSGEGVLGLRRGFTRAGVQNLLLTLWPVSDMETVQFMSRFYSLALGGTELPLAFATTQRERLQALRKERGLRVALSGAGAMILNR